MRRKGKGIEGIKKQAIVSASAQEIGKQLESEKLAHVKGTLEDFKTTIGNFARTHRDKINADPEFRYQFHRMCSEVGIDPLSSSKGFWADLLGVSDYYFELGVIVINIAVQTRSMNGGIIELSDLVSRLNRARHSDASADVTMVSEDDVRRAVDKLSALGNGFRMLDISGKTMVLSVPTDLNQDHQTLLSLCRGKRFISTGAVRRDLGWSFERYKAATDLLIRDGMIWIDRDKHGDVFLYSLSFWKMSI
jgi:ESCRT-II complex subunit VPS22